MEQRGRKKLEDPDDVVKPVSIGLSKNNKNYLVKKFGSLSAAIKTLLPNDNESIAEAIGVPLIKKSLPKLKATEPTLAEMWAQMNKQKAT